MTRRLKTRALGNLLTIGALLLALHGTGSAHHTASDSAPGPTGRSLVKVPIGDFSLSDQEGRTFRFESLRGKVVVVAFIYTSCPDRCPLVTAALRSVQAGLDRQERGSVFFLSITTDPEVDVPAVLKSYAQRYGVDFSNWSFLTGQPRAIAHVWQAFGVAVERKARGLVNHTLVTGLVDRRGVLRMVYHGSAPDTKNLRQDLQSLLAPH